MASQNLIHVRPDDASPKARAKAIACFKEIIGPCSTRRNKNGVIEIEGADDKRGRDPQYCLIVTWPAGEDVAGAAAFIVHCADLDVARTMLWNAEAHLGEITPK